MAKLLSVKLQDSILKDAEVILKNSHTSRNAYINEAVAFYNQLHHKRKLKALLQRESKLVAASSMEVLEEFERLKDEIPE